MFGPALTAGYRPAGHDEMLRPDGAPHPHYQGFLDRLLTMPEAELAARLGRAEQYLREAGVYYRDVAEGNTGPAAEHGWPLAFLPLVLSAGEWSALECGLIQRARFLEALLADVYGPRRMVAEGHLPGLLLAANPEFLYPLAGQAQNGLPLLSFIAIDLGRAADGRWHVLSDRTQAPSGAGFALENRVATAKAFPELVQDGHVQRLAGFFHAFRDELQARNQALGGEAIGILTPGLMSETSYEHAYLARYLGFQLVEGSDLIVEADRVRVRSVAGDRPMAVLWRRMDADYADPLELYGASQIGTPGLCRAARAGNVHIVNALGAGFLEARDLAPYQHDLAELLLGEQLTLPVYSPPAAGGADMQVSTAPVLVGGQLEPRSVILRAYLARCGGEWRVMPGGFARVADGSGPQAASIRAGGRSVDVWVLSDTPQKPLTLLAGQTAFRRRVPGALPARAADNLYWLGRQVERLEQAMRLVRLYHGRLGEAPPGPVDKALQQALLRFGIAAENPLPGLAALAGTAHDIASRIRDRFSPDAWRVLAEIPPLLASPGTDLQPDYAGLANRVLGRLAGFAGLVSENMYRLNGWRFLQCGRRIERGIAFASALADLLQPALGDDALDAVLELADSRLTYRRRYSVELWRQAVLDLAVLDPLNPRSITALALELDQIVHAMPGIQAGEPLAQPARRVARLAVRLRTADAREVNVAFLKRIAKDLGEVSDLLTDRYFAPGGSGAADYPDGAVE